MKKAFLLFIAACAFGTIATADEMSSPVPQDTQFHTYYRSCESPYLGRDEECITNDDYCPPGYESIGGTACGTAPRPEIPVQPAQPDWGSCGMVCRSIYRGH